VDPQALAPLYLLWNALAVLGILSGLVLALAGYRVREHIAQLPGLVLGVLIAGGLAYLLWRGPLPTIVAAALGGWAGAAIIRAYRDAILFASGAWVGLLVALAIAAVLALLMQQMPAPWVLLLLFVIVPVVGGLLAKPHERLMVTLATAFTGGGLIVGGLARLSLHTSGGHFDANLIAAMLFGSLVIGVAGVIVQYRSGVKTPALDESASDRVADQTASRAQGTQTPHPEFVTPTPNRRRAQALTGHCGGVYSIVWDPAERWFATGATGWGESSICGYHEIYIWDVEGKRPLHRFRTHREIKHLVNDLAVSPDGRWLAAPGEDDEVFVWNTANGSLYCRLLGHGEPVIRLLVDPHGRWLATTDGQRLLVWDWCSFECIANIESDSFEGEIAVVSTRGKLGWIATNHRRYGVKLFDIASGRLQEPYLWLIKTISQRIEDWQANRNTLTASPDGRWLAFGAGHKARLFEIDDPYRNVKEWEFESNVTGIAFDPQGRWVSIISGHVEGFVTLLLLPSGEPVKEIPDACSHEERYGLTFVPSPDGRHLMIGGSAGAYVMDVDRSQVRYTPTKHCIFAVAPSPSGRIFATGGREGLWLSDTETGALQFAAPTHPRMLFSLAVSPDGRMLASGGLECVVRTWDTESCKQVVAFDNEPRSSISRNEAVAFDSSSGWIAATQHDSLVRVWSLTGRTPETFSGFRGTLDVIAALEPSPLFAAATDGDVFLFRPGKAGVIANLRVWDSCPSVRVTELVADPSGCWVAFGGWRRSGDDGFLCLWRPRNGQRLCEQHGRGHEQDLVVFRCSYVQSVRDEFRRLLDWRSWRSAFRSLRGTNDGVVVDLAASPDGRWLASAEGRGGIWLWNPNARGQSDCLHHVIASPASVLTFGPTADWLAAASGATIRFWNPTGKGSLLQEVPAGKDAIRALAVDPIGRWLFSADVYGLIRRWVLTPGLRIRPHCDQVMEPLPDGDWVVWNVPSGADLDPGRWEPINLSDGAERWVGYHEPAADEMGWAHRPLTASV
jgi:WD40 repeat protein